ncbi:MAG: type IV toxin-antitoxin system AbiEi family antitoxin domain-containing protein [Acidimicrobiales bacterium]
MSGHEQDRMLDQLARRQHGAFHRRQAVEIGFTRRMIDHRRAVGAWVTLTPSVYALASHPFTWLRQAKAAELSIAGSAVSHRSAAHLHGFDGYRPGRIELSVPRGARHDSRLATVHRSRDLVAVTRQMIQVTSVPRTVADLAAVVDPWRFERTVDGVLLARATSIDELRLEADRASAKRLAGAAELRRLIDERGDGFVPPASELEAELYRALDDPRLPPYVRQSPFPWWPGAPQRVDALIPVWRLIVEADGRRWHTRVADFERDLARDHLAKRRGYDVVRLTHRQLCASPRYAVALLLEIGGHRQLAA